MAKKVFESKFFADIKYEVLDERWIDDDTYVIVFNDMKDKDGDTYHLEVEYHEDEDRITYTRVYDYENVSADHFITHIFKKQFEEYILQQVGILRNDSYLVKKNINVELTLGVPKDMTVGEFQQWLSDLKFKVSGGTDNEIVVLKVENKGVIYGK